jgi:hypothetical protein
MANRIRSRFPPDSPRQNPHLRGAKIAEYHGPRHICARLDEQPREAVFHEKQPPRDFWASVAVNRDRLDLLISIESLGQRSN